MIRFNFSIYDIIHTEDTYPNTDGTIIRIFAHAENNKSIMITVNDFNPYCYIELPDYIEWNSQTKDAVLKKIQDICKNNSKIGKIEEIKIVMKERIYYANLYRDKNNKYQTILFPYIFLSFKSRKSIDTLKFSLNRKLTIPLIGDVNLKIDELTAKPDLQMRTFHKLNCGGWNSALGVQVKGVNKESTAYYEFICSYKDINPIETINIVTAPKILCFDCEMVSKNPNAMPDHKNPDDKIFQLSTVLFRRGEAKEKWRKVLLTLGRPQGKYLRDIEVREYKIEVELLIGFFELIKEYSPEVIIGYNIMKFDIPYLIERSKMYNVLTSEMCKTGIIPANIATIGEVKWESKAYGKQIFKTLSLDGRIFIDLLPIVQRTYTFNNYKLSTVATEILGHTKDPLTPHGIFKCYRMGIENPKSRDTVEGKEALALCGKYCMVDSIVTAELFEKLNMWVGLCEESTILNSTISSLYIKGQQVRTYNQVFRLALHSNTIVQDNAFVSNDGLHGADVLDPIPGLHKWAVPFDFTSLYPSVMIANNISHNTLVNDKYEYQKHIADEDCNIFEWEDHIRCIHDETVRKEKKGKVACGKHKFRWFKGYKGIMCILVADLLDSRNAVKKQIKTETFKLKELQIEAMKTDLKENLKEIQRLELLLVVLDKRQWSLKISANSAYGAMGVKEGYLPLMPGAMCTTAGGRKYLHKAIEIMTDRYNGTVIYGDTDSTMVKFGIEDPEKLWDYCMKIEEEIKQDFPHPMGLAFEKKIYRKMLLLTKKRYHTEICGRDGVVYKVDSKGVILNRRDNSIIIRGIYKNFITDIMNEESRDIVIDHIMNKVNELFTRKITDIKEFIVTKKVNDVEGYADKRKELDTKDNKEIQRLFKLKKCDDRELYRLRCLPAHVQLACVMKQRGQIVDVGTRLEYLTTERGGVDGKQWEKIEDPTYFAKYSDILRVDYLYYLRALVPPIDEVLSIVHKLDHYTLRTYKLHLQKYKLNKEIYTLFSPIEEEECEYMEL